MLIIETVPLAVTEGFDTGVVVATCSAPRMDHDREQFKGQQTLKKDHNIFCWKTMSGITKDQNSEIYK